MTTTEAREPGPLASEELFELLNTLKKIAEKATDRKPVESSCGRQSHTRFNAIEFDSWVADEKEKMNLHEIVDPARAVLAVLRNDANSGVVFMALGDGDLFEGIASRDALLADLEKLAALGARVTPPKNSPWRPSRIDLRLLVGHLANNWVILTNANFTSDWRKEAAQ